MSYSLGNILRAAALSTIGAGSTAGCVMVAPIVIPPTASGQFEACANDALNRHVGAGIDTNPDRNIVARNGYIVMQYANGSVRIGADNVRTTDMPATQANMDRILSYIMSCK